MERVTQKWLWERTIRLHTVRNYSHPEQRKALDELHNEWVEITLHDFPDERCGICNQFIDNGWMILWGGHSGIPALPCVVCKNHCVVNGVEPPKYRSIDDE